jgi:hypothetical protein
MMLYYVFFGALAGILPDSADAFGRKPPIFAVVVFDDLVIVVL